MIWTEIQVYSLSIAVILLRPGGDRGYRPPKAKFMRQDDSGQFWGADFENRNYTGKFRGLQPRFEALSLIFKQSISSYLE